MTLTFAVRALIGAGALLASAESLAQPVPPPVIQRVTIEPAAGVVTITGTGLGSHLHVTIEGQPATVFPGASDTQMTVAAPATLLTTAGAYRLTIVDPVTVAADSFVVTSTAESLITIGNAPILPSSPPAESSRTSGTSRPAEAVDVRSGAQPVVPAPQLLEGPSNTAVGQNALMANTTGGGNSALGASALSSNTTGLGNTAVGLYALRGNVAGWDNTATGIQALDANSSGSGNTASGSLALASNTTGSANTAQGQYSLRINTVGHGNTASGHSALSNTTTGNYNIAFGHFAGSNAGGSHNVYLGAFVQGLASDAHTMRLGLPFDSASAVGQNRTFIAGVRGTTISGGESVFIDAAGQLGSGPPLPPAANTVGSAQVINDALTAADLAAGAVGASELAPKSVSATHVIFPYAGSASQGGPASDVACTGCIGATEVAFTFASLSANTFTGTQTLTGGNLDLGMSSSSAGNVTKSGSPFLHDTGVQNTFLGINAGNFNLSGTGNTAGGHAALTGLTTGFGNTGFGASALADVGSGSYNTATGSNALATTTTGNTNTASGADALGANTTGSGNTAVGRSALLANTAGHTNTAVGRTAMMATTTGALNTAIGAGALAANDTGDGNVALGASAGAQATGSYNVFIGADVIGSASDSHTIRLGAPYNAALASGQNQTFIAGIHGTPLTGPAVPVYVDANGQLGTITPPIVTGTISGPLVTLQQRLDEQQSTIADLQRELRELRAQLAARDAWPRRRQ
jgi:hypothetical protein